MVSKLGLHIFNRTARVDRNEAEFVCEAPIFIDQPALVTLERIEQIGPPEPDAFPIPSSPFPFP